MYQGYPIVKYNNISLCRQNHCIHVTEKKYFEKGSELAICIFASVSVNRYTESVMAVGKLTQTSYSSMTNL